MQEKVDVCFLADRRLFVENAYFRQVRRCDAEGQRIADAFVKAVVGAALKKRHEVFLRILVPLEMDWLLRWSMTHRSVSGCLRQILG